MWRGRSTNFSQIHVRVLEARLGLAARAREGVGHLGFGAHDAHPAAAAAAARLEDDRVADALRLARGVRRVFEHAAAGEQREAEALRRSLRAVTLSPQARIASGVGPMNVIPHLPQMRANSAFSERKP